MRSYQSRASQHAGQGRLRRLLAEFDIGANRRIRFIQQLVVFRHALHGESEVLCSEAEPSGSANRGAFVVYAETFIFQLLLLDSVRLLVEPPNVLLLDHERHASEPDD